MSERFDYKTDEYPYGRDKKDDQKPLFKTKPRGSMKGNALTESQKLFKEFNSNLDQAKPYLFELARKVITASIKNKWNLILGDDTSGRLPTRFIRKLLQNENFNISTRYICASRSARTVIPIVDFNAYVDKLTGELPNETRVLVVTESIGSGTAAKFIESLLRRRFNKVDFAVVSSRFGHPNMLSGNVYIGGEGDDAADIIHRTFEKVGKYNTNEKIIYTIKRMIPHPLRKRLIGHTTMGRRSSYPLTNLASSDEKHPFPFAHFTDDKTYTTAAHASYLRIDQLAEEFSNDGHLSPPEG